MKNIKATSIDISYRFLNDIYIPEIHSCWMEAFKDYELDTSYMTVEVMVNRAIMDRVDYSFSVGAFNRDKMVGFLIIALDTIGNQLYAFDAGTGIIPEFRGKGIAGAMFKYSLLRL